MNTSPKLRLKCASDLLDVMPWLRHYMRTVIRGQRQEETTITLQEVRVLARLKRFPSLTLSMLAEELGISKATASLLIERMVQQRLVAREKNLQRKREVILNATAAGLRQLEKTLHLLQDNLASQMEDLSLQELQHLEIGLNVVRKMLKVHYPHVQSIH